MRHDTFFSSRVDPFPGRHPDDMIHGCMGNTTITTVAQMARIHAVTCPEDSGFEPQEIRIRSGSKGSGEGETSESEKRKELCPFVHTLVSRDDIRCRPRTGGITGVLSVNL